MRNFDTKDEYSDYFKKPGFQNQPRIELSRVRVHPFLLANINDNRIIQWAPKWVNLNADVWSTTRVEEIDLNFCALVLQITYWESALRGSDCFHILDFFNFFSEGTKKWLELVIERKEVHIQSFYRGNPLEKLHHIDLVENKSVDHYSTCLKIGIDDTKNIDMLTPLPTNEVFELSRKIFLSNWKDNKIDRPTFDL